MNDSSDSCPWRREYILRQWILIEKWKSIGVFVEAYLEGINCFWFQFNPTAWFHHMILAVLLIIIFIIGSLSNTLVLYIISTSKHLQTPVNIFIANLAVSDLIMLITIPLAVFSNLLQGPVLGFESCLVYGFLGGISGCVSIMSSAAVAFNRYLVIKRWPNKYKRNRKSSLFWTQLSILAIWLYSGSIAALPFFGFGNYVPEGYLTTCSIDYLSEDSNTRLFVLAFLVMAWLVPVTVIVTSYVAVFCYVDRNKTLMPNGNQRTPVFDEIISTGLEITEQKIARRWKRDPFELKIAKTSAGLTFLWLIFWTPYAIAILLAIYGLHNFLSPDLIMISTLFIKLSAAINPFVYSLNHSKIRKEILHRYRQRFRRRFRRHRKRNDLNSNSYAPPSPNRRPNLISIDSDYARPLDDGSSHQPLLNFASGFKNSRLVDPNYRSISNNIGGVESVEYHHRRYVQHQQQPFYDSSSRSNRGDNGGINQARPRRVRFDTPITTRLERADIRDKNKPNRANNRIRKEKVSNFVPPKNNKRYNNKAGSNDTDDNLSMGLSSSFSVNPHSRKWRDLSQYRQ